MKDGMNNLKWVPTASLKPSEFRANWISRPDLRQLQRSMQKHGILSPLVVDLNTNTIIDGHARHSIALELDAKFVPVNFVDCDVIEAILLHLSLNRNRGEMVARYVSNIVRRAIMSGKYEDEQDLRLELGMSQDEFEVLADGTLLKHRKISDHTYSRAWVPVESDKKEDIIIERPTGHSEQNA